MIWRWIAGIAGLAAVAGVGWYVVRQLAQAPERGAETLPDGRIVAWEIRRVDGGAWAVAIGIGRDPMTATGSAESKDQARVLLESKLRDLRAGTPTIGGTVFRTV